MGVSMKNAIIEQVKHAIREPHAWPGGYPVYTVLSDGELLCAKCARAEFRQIVRETKQRLDGGWRAAGAEILWEGKESCAHCHEDLPSAYGE
jgi:hypothetical protein